MTCVKCSHEGTKKFGYCGRKRVQRWRCLQCKATFIEPTSKPLANHTTEIVIAARAWELMMDGSTVRSISRLTGLHIHTILALMVTAGEKCEKLLDKMIRNVRPNFVEVDEIHSMVGCHEKRLRWDAPKEWGSVWCWLGIDRETKLIISHYVGDRDANSAWHFMRSLRARTEGIFQLTSDALKCYPDAVDAHFANQIHYAQLIKLYSSPDITGPDWYGATSRVTGTIPSIRSGQPDKRYISRSHIERLNLSLRVHLRRYVRRTNAHSRKLANHKSCVSLFVAWYNLVRVNTAIRMTPGMASGLTSTLWTMRDLLCA